MLTEPLSSERRRREPSHAVRPLLLEWKRNVDGTLSGLVFNKPGMADGSWLTTSAVRSMDVVDGVTQATTASGTTYNLGEQEQPGPAVGGTRRSHRAHVVMGSGGGFLRSLQDAVDLTEMLQPHGLSYVCGGAEAGGLAADALLLASFTQLDSAIVNLSGKYASAERVVLCHNGEIAAAAVVQARARGWTVRVYRLPQRLCWRQRRF